MSTDLAALTAFVTARLDEDEATAAGGEAWEYRDTWVWSGPFEVADIFGSDMDITGEHIARHDPARALRRVAAIRRILARHHADEHGMCAGCAIGEISGDPQYEIDECPELRDIAAIWEDRADYQAKWAP